MLKYFISMFMFTSVGDSVDYSERGSCTSNFIRSIDATVEVVDESDSAFEINVDYDIRMRLGRERDDISKSVDKYLFTEEFLVELRETGHYDAGEFKINYRGPDGSCDLVNIYDLDDFDGDIDATICFGEPVLGIVEAEVEGRLSGISFRACVEMD